MAVIDFNIARYYCMRQVYGGVLVCTIAIVPPFLRILYYKLLVFDVQHKVNGCLILLATV